MSTPIAPECLAAAKGFVHQYQDSLREYIGAEPELAQLIQDCFHMTLLEAKTCREICAELEWMREDKSLGLTLGDRFYFEGIRALRRQRDAYKIELAKSQMAIRKAHDLIAFPLTRTATEAVSTLSSAIIP